MVSELVFSAQSDDLELWRSTMVQPGEISDSVSADSSCPATSDSSSSTKINQTFINKKLNLQWKQQVLLTIRSHGLQKFLSREMTVPSAKVPNSEGELVENEAYEWYIQRDCGLASWLLLL